MVYCMGKGVRGSKYGLLQKSFWIQAFSHMHASPMHPTLISLIWLKKLEKLIFIPQLLFLPRLLVWLAMRMHRLRLHLHSHSMCMCDCSH
jgi:hypothetical protein